jgi:hypothetical protein
MQRLCRNETRRSRGLEVLRREIAAKYAVTVRASGLGLKGAWQNAWVSIRKIRSATIPCASMITNARSAEPGC